MSAPDTVVRLLVVLPGAVFAAAVSFLLVERPFLMLRAGRREQSPIAPATAAMRES